MINVSACVICDGNIRRVRQAIVAPFLARRIWNRSPFCVDLVQCASCAFSFYNPRLDPAEEKRLYAGYRSEEYQRARHASEPWYTARFNAGLGSPASYDARRRTVQAILSQYAGKRAIRRVLDYGGDRGDLARGLIDGAAAFVYDISSIPAVEEVTSTSDPMGCNADLIINSNVLEHVGFPRQLLGECLKASPTGGLIFVEVPSESAFGWDRIIRRIAQIGITSITRPGLATSILRPSSLYMMHEHVNYFTEQSLATLMRSSGGAVIGAGSYSLGKGNVAWCLGTTTCA